MKRINYLEIIKKSLKITWKNKYLWWFGLFLALGGGSGLNFNFPGGNNWVNNFENGKESINNFFSQYTSILIPIAVVVIFLGIAFFVFRILSQAGIIKSLDKIEKKEAGNFKEELRQGKKYFWRLLAIILMLGFFILCLFVILFIPVIFLFYLKSLISGILSAFLAILIFIPLIILASFIGKYASYYIVLSELNIGDSLENSYSLFKKNILPSIIMALIFIPIGMILAFAVALVILFIGLIFLITGLILYIIFSKIGIFIAIITGVPFLLAVLILVSSVYQVFYQVAWFLFFKEIATVKEEERIEETIEETARKSLPRPEEA